MTATDLKSALAARNAAADELAELQRFGVAIDEQHAQALRVTKLSDLQDESRVGTIIELEVLKRLVPQCIGAREDLLTAADASLQKACETFVSISLAPKLRALEEKTAKSVRESLSRHFSDDVKLENAVQQSDAVREVALLGSAARITTLHNGVVSYATGLLAAWDKTALLEKKLA